MRLWQKVGLAAIVASLMLISAPTGAQAATRQSDTATAAIACVNIGTTYKSGATINGSGSISQSCSGQATLTMQRYRWYGWESLTTRTVTGPGYVQPITYNCYNTGTHEFRTIIEARHLNGSYEFKESNHITVTC